MKDKKIVSNENAATAGAMLREYREGLKIPRERIAVEAGIAVATVARIELGKEQHPRIVVIGKLIKALTGGAGGNDRRWQDDVLRTFAGIA